MDAAAEVVNRSLVIDFHGITYGDQGGPKWMFTVSERTKMQGAYYDQHHHSHRNRPTT